MNLNLVDTPFFLNIYGLGAMALNGDHVGTIFRLSEKVWQSVKANDLKNKGRNVWVYEQNEKVFAGIELNERPEPGTNLEQKDIWLAKYAYYKHVGSYKLLKEVGIEMRRHLAARGIKTCLPFLEIYGHWSADESNLETELYMCLQ